MAVRILPVENTIVRTSSGKSFAPLLGIMPPSDIAPKCHAIFFLLASLDFFKRLDPEQPQPFLQYLRCGGGEQ
jgi:hypothetical protein